MSEYVDHYALLKDASSLADLRGQVASVVDDALIVVHPVDPNTGLSTVPKGDHARAETLWSAREAPSWVVIAAPGPLADSMVNLDRLATLGPLVHMFTTEDGLAPDNPVRWRMHAAVGGATWSVMTADTPWGDRWFGVTDTALMAAGPAGLGDGLASLAAALGTTEADITDTLILDGGTAFKALAGIADIYLFDQFVFGSTFQDGVRFFYEFDY
ncbi:MAG: hypothetical protein AAFY65_13720 [Pseudomonadota bacterium]